MLADISMQSRMPQQAAWRPDPRASLALAFGALVLASGGFLVLLYKPVADSNRMPFSLLLVAAPPAHKVPADRRPRTPVAQPVLAPPPPREPVPPALDLTTLQLQVATVVRETVQNQSGTGPFLQVPTQKYDDLDRALPAPSKLSTLKQGESYRSNYGETILKSGEGCTAEQEVQTGVTPANHTTVGFMVPCPGEYQPSMADQLAEWAKKIRKEQLPPP